MPLHPDILATLRRTWTHICAHVLVCHAPKSTAALPVFIPLAPRRCVALLTRPDVRTLEQRVNTLALAGDVSGTARACWDWRSAITAAMKEETHG